MGGSSDTEFRVLGPFEVLIDGRAVALGGVKPRLVLAALVLHANSVVSADRLIDIVWADDPPASAIGTLRKYVFRLRNAIEPRAAAHAESALRTCAPGYVLQLDAEHVDATRFERLVTDARQTAARGDLARAATALDEALGLWRGAAWAEFADEEFARTEVGRLDELRTVALEARAEIGLAAGRHAEMIGELEATAAQHALRERPHAQLMVALYRSGRQTDALRVYQVFRRHLADEVGLEPSPELRGLEASMARQETALDWVSAVVDDRQRSQGTRPESHAALPSSVSVAATGPPFVGRDLQLEQLASTWKRAVAGDPQLVLIGGEPGIGKTRLAAELAIAVHDDGAVVLHGRCDEGMGVPYQPFVEALRHDVDQDVDVGLRERLGRYGGELVRLVPELADRAVELPAALRSDPETEQYRLFDAVTGWLTARSPVLLVLDDLQWAAAPTILLLRHVVRSTESASVMIVGTYRTSELGAADPLVELLADLRGTSSVERVELGGLDGPGVRAFVTGVAGHELDGAADAFAVSLHARTSGNPFFVGELLRNLAESGAIFERNGDWIRDVAGAEFIVPAGVREVVRRRIGRLAPSTGEVLRNAAVIGPEFDVEVLGLLVTLDDDVVLGALDAAVAAGLLRETGAGRYRFTHALVQAALYDELSTTRRARMHEQVGLSIETAHADRLDQHLAELAHHFTQAASHGQTDKAVEYNTRAAGRALAQLAPHEAVRYYEQALELLAIGGSLDEARRCDLLIALGEAQRRSGEPLYFDTLLEAAGIASRLDDADLLADVALASRTRTFFGSSRNYRRVAIIEAALEAVGVAETPARARLLAALAASLSVGEEGPSAVSHEAVAIARRVGDPRLLVEVLEQHINSNRRSSNLAERLALSAEAADLAEALADPALAWPVAWQHLWAAWEGGDRELADRQFGVLLRLCNELDQPTPQYFAALAHTTRAMIEGGPDEVERLAYANIDLGQKTAQPDVIEFAGPPTMFALRFQDRAPELLALTEDLGSQYPYQLVEASDLAFAQLCCWADRTAEARAIFEQFATGNFALADNALWTISMARCAEICAHLDDAVRAEVLYDRLAPYRDHFVAPGVGWWGSVAHYLGLLATTRRCYDVADADFAHAAAGNERLGARPWLALTRLEWAGMLLRRNEGRDGERARALLDEAVDTAQTLGIPMIERRAAALLDSEQ